MSEHEKTYHELELVARSKLKFIRFVRDDAGHITGAWCHGRHYAVSEFPPELDSLKQAWERLGRSSQMMD
jgi:hypothetical protein